MLVNMLIELVSDLQFHIWFRFQYSSQLESISLLALSVLVTWVFFLNELSTSCQIVIQIKGGRH